MKKTNTRLSKNVLPQKYQLLIRPDMEAFTFTGEETISITITEETKKITLHSKDIEVLNANIRLGKQVFEALKISYNTTAETVSIEFAKKLPVVKAKLQLYFRGVISDDLRGFYRSQYEQDGETKHIATTQFESTDARRAFPCFDEPAQKAIFNLKLVIPKHLSAISNTMEIPTPAGIEHDEGYKVVTFASTPKMSTYLLAYIIGDFESIETLTKDNVKIRIFTTKGKKHQAKFALETAKRSLEFLNAYFAIPYPLPVLDLIAIPDFSSAAMENWGAVTFREAALFVDENNTAFANKQHVAEVIAHELVHQWFGNLVTMEWWTHLWLNESFASFMAYIVMDDLFPEWKIWTRFTMHDHVNALELDSLENTHPIEVEVHHPSQISEIFDAISYDKGASVLRMLLQYIGPDQFRDGLRYYLKKHSYKNTESVDLWNAFEDVSKKPISKFMQNWVLKPGYPLISIAETKLGKVTVLQERFGLQKIADKTIWQIPLQLELRKGLHSDVQLFDTKKKEFSISHEGTYIKTNPGESGFYRTLYTPALLAKLYAPIKNKELSIIDRFGVIRDVFAMVKSGRLPTSVYLEFLSAYTNEDSYIVWTELLSGMAKIYNIVDTTPELQQKLAAYYLHVLNKVVVMIGWNSESKESQSRPLLRAAVLYANGNYGNIGTIKKAERIFASRKKVAIMPDLRATVYTLNAQVGDAKKFDELKKMFIAETLHEEQRRIGRAIVSFNDPTLFEKGLEFTLSSSVRAQDAPLLLVPGLQNSTNKLLGWNWLQENWPVINKRYEHGHFSRMIIKSLHTFTDLKYAKQLESFFKKYPSSGAERAINQTIEHIKLNAAWLKRDKKDISDCINRLGSL